MLSCRFVDSFVAFFDVYNVLRYMALKDLHIALKKRGLEDVGAEQERRLVTTLCDLCLEAHADVQEQARGAIGVVTARAQVL
jgi:hypothetical protein